MASSTAAPSPSQSLSRASGSEPVLEDDISNRAGNAGAGAAERIPSSRAPAANHASTTTSAATALRRDSELRQRHVSTNNASSSEEARQATSSPASATHTTSLIGPPHAIPPTTAPGTPRVVAAETPQPQPTAAAMTTTATGRATHAPRPQITLRARAVAGVKDLGIVTAVVGSTYLLADHETVFPFAIVACVLTVSSVVVKYALSSMPGVRNRSRVRHLHHHRHFCGERAQYVRTNQRLAMMDRDFTPADYEMLLDLDNHSQRFRRFLEGASEETIARLPTFVYKKPKAACSDGTDGKERSVAAVELGGEDEITASGGKEMDICKSDSSGVGICGKDDVSAEESSLFGATARKCMICLEDFEDGMLILTLPCLHRFMSECIEPWLTQQAKCPVCKCGIEESMNSMPPGFC